MKDRKFYMPTHPGSESQFKIAAARMRVAEEEGETAHFPATALAAVLGSKGYALTDANPYFGTSDSRQVATLTTGHIGTLAYVSESGSSPGGHRFLSNAAPAAGDEMMLCATRGMLIQGTPAGSEPEYSDAYVFTTQLQVSSTSATNGIGFACGWAPSGTTVTPLTTVPANGIWFEYNPGGANPGLQFKTVEASGSVHAIDGVTNPFNLKGGTTGAFTPAASTDLRLTLAFGQTVSGNTWGGVHVGSYAPGQAGVFTPMTAAQVADVAAMITAGTVYLSPFVGAYVVGTTQRSMYVQNVVAFADK